MVRHSEQNALKEGSTKVHSRRRRESSTPYSSAPSGLPSTVVIGSWLAGLLLVSTPK